MLCVSALHPAPPVWLRVEVEDGRVTVVVSGEPDPLYTWLGVDGTQEAPLSEAQRQALIAAAPALFEEGFRVTIDGVRTSARVEGFKAREDFEVDVLMSEFTLVFPCEGTPKIVDMVWELFEGTDDGGQEEVPGMVRFGPVVDELRFRPDEPQFTWRARTRTERPPPEAVRGGGERQKIAVGIPSLALAALALTIVGVRRRIGLSLRAAGTVALALFVGSWTARETARISFVPPWAGPISAGSPEQRLAIFRALHRNVYAAFEGTSEDEIYELLAVSVEPAMLDPLYGEIYESLVMRAQGGAICTIDLIEDLYAEALPLEDEIEGAFEVLYRWRVHGVVSHWGHAHRRFNEYEARYRMRYTEGAWRIADMEVLDLVRVDDFD